MKGSRAALVFALWMTTALLAELVVFIATGQKELALGIAVAFFLSAAWCSVAAGMDAVERDRGES